MPSQFAAQTMPLGQLVRRPPSIDAPTYQRPFSWTPRRRAACWTMLPTASMEATAKRGDRDYFLGTDAVHRADRADLCVAAGRFTAHARAFSKWSTGSSG